MITRYDVRNACFRMKKGVKPTDLDILQQLEEAKGNRSWQDFDVTWDVVVKNNKPVVIASIKDINMVIEVCAKKSLTAEMNIDREWSEQELSVIQTMEAQFLDGIMTWENFRKRWNVRWNSERNRIDTFLINQPAIQTEVTQEMIDRKLQEAMSARKPVSATLEVRPMTEEEKLKYTQMLADGKI
jgi:hypothetical protein